MSLLTQYWLEAGGSARIQAEEVFPPKPKCPLLLGTPLC